MPRRGLFTYENALVLILGLTFGVVFLDRQAASNLMIFIRPDLRLDDTEVGLIGSALAITWAISAFGVAWLSDKTGSRKRLLILCVIGFSTCCFISGLARSYEVLLASRFFMGLLEGGVMPICLAIMAVESSERRRGMNAGIVQNGFSNLLGNSAGPPILIAMATLFSWRQAFYVAAVPGLLCAVAIWLWVKEPPQETSHGADDAPKMSIFEMLKVRNMLVCSLVSIFMVAWLLIGFSFLPVYFKENKGLSPATVAGLMAALGFCAFLGGALVPALSDRFGRKPLLLIGTFGSIITPLTALYFHGPLWAFGSLLFIGWIGNCIFPMFMGTIPGESLPRAYIATAMGIVVGVGEIIGGVLGPFIAGWISDHSVIGRDSTMLVMTVCAVIAGVIALFLKETAPAKVGTPAHEPIIAPVA
jgi:predicted MFS family arabinose efflux permease